jgi:pimeloyl-ACP methyl ester carboxylesterase
MDSKKRGLNRRGFCGAAAASVAALPLGLISLPERATAMTEIAQQPGSDSTAIRPFRVNVAAAELAELRRRVNATRWPDRELVADDSQGVQLATIQALARYWGTDYDWRKCEAKLNALPQFITEIDGLDIHFIHVRSKHGNALPLIVTHGWPGSIIEQLKIIDPLTDPTAHGGNASDAFHLVIPSLPGYGFSVKPPATGWEPARIARAWVVLMKRLGYSQFVAQGGDWGAVVANVMAQQAPPVLLGIHVNFPATITPAIGKALAGAVPPDFSADEQRAVAQLRDLNAKHLGYYHVYATRPQTMAGLTDSPVGLAAWVLDHDGRSYALIARAFDGHEDGGLTRDDVLDNITLYWLTNTAVSSGRIFWETHFNILGAANVSVPAAVSAFPDEIYQAPQSWTEQAYHKLVYYNRPDQGGHYAAWTLPLLFSQEVRAGFRGLRQSA